MTYPVQQMPKAPTNPLGLAQLQDFDPPKEITVHGVKWSLRRDYRDPLSSLPPPKDVKWDESGFIPMTQYEGRVSWYCIYGTKFPTPGSQERPMRVLYQWFHTVQMQLNPNFITDVDWSRANVYVADYGAFAQDFFGAMFNVHEDMVAQRQNVQEWPAVIDVNSVMGSKEQRVKSEETK